MSAKLDWKGNEVYDAIKAKVVAGVDKADLVIESASKAELYPGHGKRTGTLQRAIQALPIKDEGSRVIGGVGVRGVKYALRIHALYSYILNGLDKTRGQVAAIIGGAVK